MTDEMTIYDVFRGLVERVTSWKDEGEKRRYLDAIRKAEDNELFRTEGRFKL